MKIDVTEDGVIRLKEVFNSIIIETAEGNQFPICLRDDGIEIGILDTSKKHEGHEKYYNWYSVRPCGIKQLHFAGKSDNIMMLGKFVTAKLKGQLEPRQGWFISESPLLIQGQSGTVYECEGKPVVVVNPPNKGVSQNEM